MGSAIFLTFTVLLSVILFALINSITCNDIIKCNSSSDCNEKEGYYCVHLQCLKIVGMKTKCRDNDDCNEITVSGHADGTEKKLWLKCLKDPDEKYGHCHPANTKYIQLIDEDLIANTTSNETNYKYSLEMKRILVHHFENVSTLHYPMCKLLNDSSVTTSIHNDFLHFYHESLYHPQDNFTKTCGVEDEFPVRTSSNTNTRFAMAEDTNDEELYPIPPCGYGVCDNPNYRKKYFSIQSIINTNRTRIIFLHFHVFPSVQFADTRIAASVRRMNEMYRHGNIMFLAFVSSYYGKYANSKLTREQERGDCIRINGPSRCVLDSEVIKDIYGEYWRKRGSFHVIVGPLYHNGLLGWSHFPWVSLHGLVVVGENELDARSTTLPHEIGHAVGGLHHVFRGRENLLSESPPSCHSCIEHEPSDWTGDLCKDTNPTPEQFECKDPTIQERPDPCNPNRKAWINTPYANIMSYAPSYCHIGLTNDQFERIHCWISQYRNAFHMLTPDEEVKLAGMMEEECYTKEDGSDYRGRFDDFGACKPWPSTWWNLETGILAGDNACRNPNPNVNAGLWCFYKENGENPTLCSLSGTLLFLNSTCRPNARYDYRYVTALDTYRECFTDPMGYDYRGTHTEPFCVKWPKTDLKHGLSVDHNYCRNPVPNSESSNRPWCFTQPGGKEPRYCNLDIKTNLRISCPRIPPNSELKRECYSKENFSDYRGTFSNFGACDMWPVDDPANGVSRTHNYCRNPDNSPSLWCYEDSYTKKAIYCDISEVRKFHNPNCNLLP